MNRTLRLWLIAAVVAIALVGTALVVTRERDHGSTHAVASGPSGGTAIRRCAQVDAQSAGGMSAQVCQEGASTAGQPTTLHLTASDGDARVRNDCGSPVVEWGDEPSAVCAIGCAPSEAPSGPSSIDVSLDHTYAHPGTYTVKVTVESNCGAQPHGERCTLELTLVIRDPNQPPDGTG